MSNNFDESNLLDNLLRGIYSYGLEKLLPVQVHILNPEKPSAKSSLIQWHAGSGKSVGMAIKVLKLVNFNQSHLQGLILLPTEYLAMQIYKILIYLSDYITDPNISMEYSENPRILVTTPQQAIDNKVNVSGLVILAIDEMNALLEIGGEHRKCIKTLFTQIPNETEILCIGCELPSPECYIHDEHLKNSIIVQNGTVLHDWIVEKFVYCPKIDQKIKLLKEDWIQSENFAATVFCNTYNRAEKMEDLVKEAFPALQLVPRWGKLSERFATFRQAMFSIGTESDWYGIDIHWCNFVVHFDVVCNVTKSRLRTGRCGRSSRNGFALYLPSTLEELDFVCGMLLGSASSKHQRVMMKDEHYSDISIIAQNFDELLALE